MASKYYCFRCGQEGAPVERDDNHILGLCSCHSAWSVGTVPQLIDRMNEMVIRLEGIDCMDDNLYIEDYNPEQLEFEFFDEYGK